MLHLLDLAQDRKIVIRSIGKQYAIVVPRISEASWFEFFNAIVAKSTHKRGTRPAQKIDLEPAIIDLAERLAVASEGYEPIASVAKWQSRIPSSHRLAFGNVLIEAYAVDSSASTFASEVGSVWVRLSALWSARADGVMGRHSNLVHYFAGPSEDQRRRYRRGFESAQIGNVNRGGKKILRPQDPLCGRVLIELYNELIIRVDGYSVRGEPLCEDRASISLAMDAFHKRAAATELFAPTDLRKGGE